MRQRNASMLQVGVALVVIGIVIRLAMMLTWALAPITNFLIIAGIIVVIIGLVTPNRS